MPQGYYDARVYERVGGARKKAVLSLIPQGIEGKTLLDVGCSNGEFGQMLKIARGLIVHGIDVSRPATEEAKGVLDAVFLADLETGDIRDIVGIRSSYDYILVSEVLEHLFYPERLLAMLKHCSGSDTRIILTVPNLLFWKNRLKILLGYFDYTDTGLMDRGHIHIFSHKSFLRMLSEAGLEVKETAHNIPTRGTKWLGRIFPGLFAFQFIVSTRWKQGNDRS